MRATIFEEVMSNLLKSIKVTEGSHQALQLAKAMEGVKITEFVSTVVLEAIEKEYPEVYQLYRKRATQQESTRSDHHNQSNRDQKASH